MGMVLKKRMRNAICEMTPEELKKEYLFCVEASNEKTLRASDRRYFHDRAAIIKEYISEQESDNQL